MAQKSTPWEMLSLEAVTHELETNIHKGLSTDDARLRQQRYGMNVLKEGKRTGVIEKIGKQFKSPLVFILLGAFVTTLVLASYLDAIVILIALLINVVVGFLQEERASRAFEKLKASQEKHATVIRDGKKKLIPAAELVVGDIVELLGGSYVPADIRLTSAKNLAVNEAVLTGEWASVSKELRPVKEKTPLAERVNMVWMGTLVASGFGTGVVVATGSHTEVGKIAAQLGTIDERVTPLQQSIRKVARFLAYIIIASIAIIFALGIFRGEPIGSMLLIAIAIAVATVPEGLPAAVTVVLALGMESILKRGGLVRNLLAAETLGATTVILTDKTGTLTEAKMKLASLYTHDSLTQRTGTMTHDDRLLLKMAVLASDAFVEENHGGNGALVIHGRPIERAVVAAGLDAGLSQSELATNHRRIDFLQFESRRRFGASLNHCLSEKNNRLYFTGAPEFLLAHSNRILEKGESTKLSAGVRKHFEEIQEARSKEGMRFIGIAYRTVPWDTIPTKKMDPEELLKELTFAGFISFFDPIRPDVAESIDIVKRAGATVIMLTGDNIDTAKKIARDVGIFKLGDRAATGADIEEVGDEELYHLLKSAKVFARVLPEQKLRIARVLKNHHEVVAMTGDGVNDAPALRSANIGVAVGAGTEVAKEASDIVLLDNSFSIIVGAIEEGRKIIDNLKKIVAYLLSTSFSEIFLIGGALVVGVPLPLLPAQILWANIIEEGLMSFPFAFEKAQPGNMTRFPRSHSARNIITPTVRKLIFTVGTITGIFLIGLYLFLLSLDISLPEVRTLMFIALSVDSIFFAFSLKSFDTPIWKIDIFSNRFLVVALLISVALLFGALTFPPIEHLLSLEPPSYLEMLFLLAVGLFNLATIEVAKYFIFERKRSSA